jgi:hypothetical protein
MRARRTIPSLIVQNLVIASFAIPIASLAISIAALTPAFAQEYRGTLEQQLACTPDVWRLCGDQVPDVNRIVSCLRQNTPQLSGACRAVFDSNASGPPQADPRARVDRPRPYDDQ